MKVCFPNFWPRFSQQNNFFYNLLKQDQSLTIDYCNPDLVFYSVFGDYHTRYPDDIKIFYTGENKSPPKGIKSISFEPDSENNLRVPLWYIYIDHFGIPQTGNSPSYLVKYDDLFKKWEPQSREHFCGFVFGNSAGERVNLFNELSKYKKVTSGGPLLNNYPIVQNEEFGKIEFLKTCKFSCCFENANSPGYTTEKLLHGLVSGTVPLYWGSGNEMTDFNPKRFLHYSTDLDSFIDKVKQIDQDLELYNEILQEPIFTPEQRNRFNEYLPRIKEFIN